MKIHFLTGVCQALCSWRLNNVDPDEPAMDNWQKVTCQDCLIMQDHIEADPPLRSLDLFKIMVGIK